MVYYVRNRIYEPQIARWSSLDPVGWFSNIRRLAARYRGRGLFKIGQTSFNQNVLSKFNSNLYHVVANNPLNMIDPSGLDHLPMGPTYSACCSAEINTNLRQTLQLIRTQFFRNNPAIIIAACDSLAAYTRWDIGPLFNHSQWLRPNACQFKNPDDCCADCVTVNGRKHDMHDVNYLLWGAQMKLCGQSFLRAIALANVNKSKYWFSQKGTCHPRRQHTVALQKWIFAGYESIGPTPLHFVQSVWPLPGVPIWNPFGTTFGYYPTLKFVPKANPRYKTCGNCAAKWT